MYENKEFQLLKNNQKRLNSDELNHLIEKIDRYYSEFNKEYERFTKNYIETMTNLMDTFSVKEFIPNEFGGALYTTTTNHENTEDIIGAVKTYLEKLLGLNYLSFLREENRNVVLVGANGSGKTTLLRHLIKLTGERDIAYYQADRLLLIDKTYNPERDDKQFQTSLSNTYKSATDIENGNQGYYINRQLNQVIAYFEKYRSSELEKFVAETIQKSEMKTKFILDIWNSLIKDRILYCDGTLRVKTLEGKEYDLKYLSSGEKSIFYFLASIILNPEKKYYFIDEPENNLNPSIVTQLWDIIEKYRNDSIFVYLTHDSDFVSGRINSKIYWIKKYNGDKWEYQQLHENDSLPQKLMIELVGNKQPVLFCESENENKYDTVLFKLMFPEYKIVSAGGCTKVISKVKAYSLIGLPQKAFGIIDCDYREEEYLSGQKKHNVYHIPFFEIENFLFCEEILKEMIAKFSNDKTNALAKVISAVKEDFEKGKETFVIRNVATRLKELGFFGKIKSLSSRQELIDRFTEFQSSINLDEYFKKYDKMHEEIVKTGDLNTILRYYDCKNILKKYNVILDFGDRKYEEEVLIFLKDNSTLLKELRDKYFKDIIFEE